jgi:hypothetical protein
MNVYVLGAGVSKCVGYPVGTELFDEIDEYVRGSGNLRDRFNYREDWDNLHRWLETNTNPTIAQAYQTKNIEHLFTILDFATELRTDALLSVAFAGRGTEERTTKSVAFGAFDEQIKDYQQYRNVLVWALEHYFAWRHHEDYGLSREKNWGILRAFAGKLEPGDAVITFNYDATLERVLLDQGKWSPKDGYGFELVFQKSRYDKAIVEFNKSAILVLHLHGATGWYRRPVFAPDYDLPPKGGGALPREALGAAPLSTDISLDPQFLEALGIFNVDACLADALPVADERHIVLHPSFLKDYERDDSHSHVFVKLWQKAAEVLRGAEHAYIVGYSLPRADVAALTLLLTTLRRGNVTVVNRNRHVMRRLGLLFGANPFDKAYTLEEWLGAGCPQRGGGSSSWVTTAS